LKKEKGLSKKENIDKLSQYMVFFRNRCKFSPVVVSQFNRSIGSTERLKFNGEQLKPTLEDFKDTGSLAEDATIVLALFNPTVFSHLERHNGYQITQIGKSYRSLHILASRNTIADVTVSLSINGKTGDFVELPATGDANQKQVTEMYNACGDSFSQQDFMHLHKVLKKLSKETECRDDPPNDTLGEAKGGGEFDFD